MEQTPRQLNSLTPFTLCKGNELSVPKFSLLSPSDSSSSSSSSSSPASSLSPSSPFTSSRESGQLPCIRRLSIHDNESSTGGWIPKFSLTSPTDSSSSSSSSPSSDELLESSNAGQTNADLLSIRDQESHPDESVHQLSPPLLAAHSEPSTMFATQCTLKAQVGPKKAKESCLSARVVSVDCRPQDPTALITQAKIDAFFKPRTKAVSKADDADEIGDVRGASGMMSNSSSLQVSAQSCGGAGKELGDARGGSSSSGTAQQAPTSTVVTKSLLNEFLRPRLKAEGLRQIMAPDTCQTEGSSLVSSVDSSSNIPAKRQHTGAHQNFDRKFWTSEVALHSADGSTLVGAQRNSAEGFMPQRFTPTTAPARPKDVVVDLALGQVSVLRPIRAKSSRFCGVSWNCSKLLWQVLL